MTIPITAMTTVDARVSVSRAPMLLYVVVIDHEDKETVEEIGYSSESSSSENFIASLLKLHYQFMQKTPEQQ